MKRLMVGALAVLSVNTWGLSDYMSNPDYATSVGFWYSEERMAGTEYTPPPSWVFMPQDSNVRESKEQRAGVTLTIPITGFLTVYGDFGGVSYTSVSPDRAISKMNGTTWKVGVKFYLGE